MKAKHTNRRSLWASGLSLVLCMAMLIGTTFAWFSDTVSNKGNKIQAGNLQIGFYTNAVNGDNGDALDESKWIDLKETADPIFVMGSDTSPAQPGDILTRYIMIKNHGTIDLKYELNAVVDDQGLGDAITFDFEQVKLNGANSIVQYPAVTGSQLNGVIAKGVSTEKDQSVVYKATIAFSESAGNEYQGKGFAVDLNLTATQNNDKAKIANVDSAESFISALNMENCPTIVLNKDITVEGNVETTKFFNLDLNGYKLTINGDFSVTNSEIGTYDLNTKKGKGSMTVTGEFLMNVENSAVNLKGEKSADEFDVSAGSFSFKIAGHTLNIDSTLVDNATKAPANITITGGAVNVVGVVLGNIIVNSDTDVSISTSDGGRIGVIDNQGSGNVSLEEKDNNDTSAWDGSVDKTPFADTSATNYTISTAAQMAGFAEVVNKGNKLTGKTVTLTADIDLQNKPWTPIGIGNLSGGMASKIRFEGTFDGGKHIIRNFTNKNYSPASSTDSYNYGIFGVAKGATIKNLSLINVDINTVGMSMVAGSAGLVGGALGNSTITDCHVLSGRIDGDDKVGGIVGTLAADDSSFMPSNISITNCSNNAKINANNGKAGGIIGYYSYSLMDTTIVNISKCTNNGAITAYLPGGCCGYFAGPGNVSEFTNTGKIVALTNDQNVGGYAGGVFGYMTLVKLNDSNWTSYNPILVGKSPSITIDKCLNSGEIDGSKSKNSFGGIVGFSNSYSKISNCTNTGRVAGKSTTVSNVGGVAGTVNGKMLVENSSNSGMLSAMNIGGIVGSDSAVISISNCSGGSSDKFDAGTNVGQLIGSHAGTGADSMLYITDTSNAVTKTVGVLSGSTARITVAQGTMIGETTSAVSNHLAYVVLMDGAHWTKDMSKTNGTFTHKTNNTWEFKSN